MEYQSELERLILHQLHTAIIKCNDTKMKQTLVYTKDTRNLVCNILGQLDRDNTKINVFTLDPVTVHVTITYNKK